MRFSTPHLLARRQPAKELLARTLLAMALLLFGAGSAGAFAIDMTTNYDGVTELGVSDTIQVHVFLDASVTPNGEGLTAVTANILMDVAELSYDQPETIALTGGTPPGYGTNDLSPYTGPYPCGANNPALYYPYADNGSRQSYILFLFNRGTFALLPFTPPWSAIPAASAPPGKQQVNLNWLSYPLGSAALNSASCTSVWLGSIVIHVDAVGSGSATTEVSLATSSAVMATSPSLTDFSASTPVTCGGSACPFTLVLPEPTGAGLSLAALATLYALRRLRRRA